jgi:hypothetical protein
MNEPFPQPHKRLRFTIGGLMITIAGVALCLALLRPLSWMVRSVYPELAKMLERLATVETGLVLSCLAVGVFAAVRLMAEDEKM